jgi:hypothetical protein
MICKKMTTAPSKIIKMAGDLLPLKAFVIHKTEPPSWFSCQINILWVVPFFYKMGAIFQNVFCSHGKHYVRYPWFRASAAMLMRSALCWIITQRHFSSRTSWTLKMIPIRYPEALVKNYHSMLCWLSASWTSWRLKMGPIFSRNVGKGLAFYAALAFCFLDFLTPEDGTYVFPKRR